MDNSGQARNCFNRVLKNDKRKPGKGREGHLNPNDRDYDYEDRIAVNLVQGTNRILVKVKAQSQYPDPDDGPIFNAMEFLCWDGLIILIVLSSKIWFNIDGSLFDELKYSENSGLHFVEVMTYVQ